MEAAQFVVGCEAQAHRVIGVSSVLRLTDEVPKRAAVNPGRHYIARSFELPNAQLSDAALDEAQAALDSRRPNRLFIKASRESRKNAR